MIDVFRSYPNPGLGAPYPPVTGEKAGKGGVELVFCNPDLIWRAQYEMPRFGQFAFKEAFQVVWKVRLTFCSEHNSDDADTILTSR